MIVVFCCCSLYFFVNGSYKALYGKSFCIHPYQEKDYSICAGPANDQQRAIVQAFLHAWSAYKKYAWGHDELKPLSKSWQEWMGIGLTIVDSIDTMYIMGLEHGVYLSLVHLLLCLVFLCLMHKRFN